MKAPPTGAAGVSEKIRRAAESYHWDVVTSGLRVTVSIGYAPLTTTMSSPQALVAAADAALYWAKRSGRNSVHG